MNKKDWDKKYREEWNKVYIENWEAKGVVFYSNRFIVPWALKVVKLPLLERTILRNKFQKIIFSKLDKLGIDPLKLKWHNQLSSKFKRGSGKHYFSSIWVVIKTIKLFEYYKKHPEKFNHYDVKAIEAVMKGERLFGGLAFLWGISIFQIVDTPSIKDIEKTLPGMYIKIPNVS